MTHSDRPIVDHTSTVDLLNGSAAVVAVAVDGTRTLWLLSDHPTPEDPGGCACAEHAPHDQVGRLPADWKRRIANTSTANTFAASAARCGAPTTTTGEPCRAWVAAPGDHCRHHRTARRRTDA